MRIAKDLVAASATPLVLGILAKEESYGYAILKRVGELSSGQLEWSDGLLYPLLHRLERLGYVESSWRAAEGVRRRKYYGITEQGRAELAEQRRQWAAVVGALRGTALATPCRSPWPAPGLGEHSAAPPKGSARMPTAGVSCGPRRCPPDMDVVEHGGSAPAAIVAAVVSPDGHRGAVVRRRGPDRAAPPPLRPSSRQAGGGCRWRRCCLPGRRRRGRDARRAPPRAGGAGAAAPRAGRCLVLRHSGLSDADVATALDRSPGSVGTTVRRAESDLRKELNRHASSD